MPLRSKQCSLFSFYALPSEGKLKGALIHLILKSMNGELNQKTLTLGEVSLCG